MCGIVLRIRANRSATDPDARDRHHSTRDSRGVDSDSDSDLEWDSLLAAVEHRGPDAAGTLTLDTRTHTLDFHATVLHLRGASVTRQPFHSPETGNVLLWNGEVFDAPHLPVGLDDNDGQRLFELIETTSFAHAVRLLDGPHALIYYNASEAKVYFSRDCLGRRSLLRTSTDTRGEFVLTSTTPSPRSSRDEWQEVGCQGVWHVDLNKLAHGGREEEWLTLDQRVYPDPARPPAHDSFVYPFHRLNRSLPTSIGSLLPMTRSLPPLPVLSPRYLSLLTTFKSLLLESVRQRVITIPGPPEAVPTPSSSSSYSTSTLSLPSGSHQSRVGILFSGGLDCTSLALLVDETLPAGEPIDLINVAFENPRKLELATDQSDNMKKKKKKETKKERQDRIKREENSEVEEQSRAGGALEREGGRDGSVEDEADEAEDEKDTMHDAEMDEAGPRPTTDAPELSSWTTTTTIYDVPDRLTGLETYSELRLVRPDRQWNFVKVDVPYREMLDHRQKVIDLMYPQDTVMDLSIAIAFYFAARGKGTLHSDKSDSISNASSSSPPPPPPPSAAERVVQNSKDEPQQQRKQGGGGGGGEGEEEGGRPYTSTARVLLSGLGADELLGGYSRHRKAYNGYRQPPPPSPGAPPPPSDDNTNHDHASSSSSSSPRTTTTAAGGATATTTLDDSSSSSSSSSSSEETTACWTRLISELQLDLDRLPHRNLGRDDRVVSQLSREVRYPFLASPIVDFLSTLPVWDKCDLRFEEGLGDKLLLRMLVRDLMKLPPKEDGSYGGGSGNAWRLKKRAIHFGARTAKMERGSGGAKGTDRL